MYRTLTFIILAFIITTLISCRKDKVQEPVVEEPTKWELIPGDYKVYDTNEVYMYDMSIVYKKTTNPQGQELDVFEFINFDDEFFFDQTQYSNPVYYYDSQLYIELGSHDTLIDTNGNRWKLSGGIEEGYNLFHNDTITLKFKKTNINYYLQDLVPYYECQCKQIAVKQY